MIRVAVLFSTLGISALLAWILTPWLILTTLPSCQSSMTLITRTAAGDVIAKGVTTLRNNGKYGSGFYHGELLRYSPDAKLISRENVSADFESQYEIRGNSLKVSTLAFTPGVYNEISPEEIYRYVYAGFEPGHVHFFRILSVDNSFYASAQSDFAPRGVCTKVL